MRILNNITALQVTPKGEYNSKKSETMPDQAISAQELLRKYATGQPLGFKNAEPIYDEDENNTIPEFYKMNKMDRMHAQQEGYHNLNERKSDFQKEVRELKQKQQKQAAEKAAQKQQEASKSKDNKANSERSEEHAA